MGVPSIQFLYPSSVARPNRQHYAVTLPSSITHRPASHSNVAGCRAAPDALKKTTFEFDIGSDRAFTAFLVIRRWRHGHACAGLGWGLS